MGALVAGLQRMKRIASRAMRLSWARCSLSGELPPLNAELLRRRRSSYRARFLFHRLVYLRYLRLPGF
jgi:hypothetical protein